MSATERIDTKVFVRNSSFLSGEMSLSRCRSLDGMLADSTGHLSWTLRGWDRKGDAVSSHHSLVMEYMGSEELRYSERASLMSAPPELATIAKGFFNLTVEGELLGVCVRCLEGVTHRVSLVRSFRLVGSEGEAERWDYDDPFFDLIPESRDFNVHDLVEEELLLSLPYVLQHQQCQLYAAVPASQ